MLHPATQQTATQQSPADQAPVDHSSVDQAAQLHEVLVDRSECNACSGCCDICPDIFEWDDDLGCPSLRRQFATHDEVREAISLCPRRCITAEGWTEEFY